MHSIGYLFKEGLKSLWKNRTMSIASVAVLISCLLMTGIAGLLSVNLSMTMKSIEGNNSITVYLEDGLPSLTAVKVGEEIKKIDNISECTLVTKDEGLERMMRDMDGSTDLFNGLLGDENPLPDAYIISMVDLSLYDQTMEQVRNINGVSKASDFRDIATKLSNLDRLVRYCSIGIVLVLSIVSLFIIANTVKVTMFSRRMEINIMKYVGATDWFIRWPFIVEGIIIGIIGALVPLVLGLPIYTKVTSAIFDYLPVIKFIQFRLTGDVFGFLFPFGIVFGVALGVIGSVSSIRKHLRV